MKNIYSRTGNRGKIKRFRHRTSYYKTPKNCYQIIKAHETTVTQQPNKIKVYTESKNPDRTLQ